MKSVLFLVFPLLLTPLAAIGPDAPAKPARPNVVIIVTDDQGFGELGATGNPLIRTPHIDRLVLQSVSLTNFPITLG